MTLKQLVDFAAESGCPADVPVRVRMNVKPHESWELCEVFSLSNGLGQEPSVVLTVEETEAVRLLRQFAKLAQVAEDGQSPAYLLREVTRLGNAARKLVGS